MDYKEAIEAISSGHDMYSVEYAQEVLDVLAPGTKLPRYIIQRWTGQKDANPNHDPKGLFLAQDAPGEGVHSLRLSYLVCSFLDIEAPGGAFFGRGTAARANAEAVANFRAAAK